MTSFGAVRAMLLRNSWTSDRGNFSELPSGYLVSINSVLKLDADSRKAHVARGTRGNRGNAHRKSEMQSCWWAVIGAQFKTDSKFGYCIGGGGKLMNWTPSQSTSLWGLGDHLFHVISNRHRFYLSLSLTTCTVIPKKRFKPMARSHICITAIPHEYYSI